MAETIRTKAELLVIFSDNTTQEISEQDMRDFVVSIYDEANMDLVKISDDDTTGDTLDNKIIGGTGVSITVLGSGGNETLSIDVSGFPTGSGTDNHIVRWDGTSDIQDSDFILTDSGGMSGGDINAPGIIYTTGVGTFARGTTNAVFTGGTIAATQSGSYSGGGQAGGYVSYGGTIFSTHSGSFAHGAAYTYGSLLASGPGSVATGSVVTSVSTIRATASGTVSSGTSLRTIEATNVGSRAGGYSGYYGYIKSSGVGSFCQGDCYSGTMSAVAEGCWSGGYVDVSGTITSGVTITGGRGAFAFGFAKSGSILSTKDGSFALGYSNSAGTSISSAVKGSFALGFANSGGIIATKGGNYDGGNFAAGFANSYSTIYSTKTASFAFGVASNYSSILSSNDGSVCFGRCFSAGTMISSGRGSLALGSVARGILRSTLAGSVAMGYSNETSSLIDAAGRGSFACGASFGGSGGSIVASANGSVAQGNVTFGGSLTSSASGSIVFGYSASGGDISATFNGAMARGYSVDASSKIESTNLGAFSSGYALTGGYLTASGVASHALGISPLLASADASLAIGQGAEARLMSQFAHSSGNPFSGVGRTQRSEQHMTISTTNATPTELTIGGVTPSASSRFTIDKGRALDLIISIIGRKEDGADHGRFLRRACIERSGTTTSLVGPVDTLGTDVTPAGWAVTISADDTNDSLLIEVTGIAASIRWSASIMAAEVVFAIPTP